MTTENHKTTYTTPTPTEVVVRRRFDAPRSLVFAAHTDPAYVPHWLTGPAGWSMPICEIDLRPGGTWHFVWRKDDGTDLEMNGSYVEVAPPALLVTTEHWGGEWPETVNTLELVETNGGTAMTYTIRYVSEEARDAALATGMKSGTSISYHRLDALLAAQS